MISSKIKLLTVLLLACGTVLAVGTFGRQALADRHETSKATESSAPVAMPRSSPTRPAHSPAADPGQADKHAEEQNVVSGQVLDVDGKPVKGAPVCLVASLMMGQDEIDRDAMGQQDVRCHRADQATHYRSNE